MTGRIRMAAAVALAIGIVGCNQPRGDLDDQAAPTTVDAGAVSALHVEAQGCDRPQPRYGVATVIDGRMAVTAGHVVEGALRRLQVGGRSARVLLVDPRLDLALVEVAPGLGDDPLAIGEATLGRAMLRGPETSSPVDVIDVLTLRVDDLAADSVWERPAIKLNVLVEPGQSGSPVLAADGELIGVLNLRREATGVSYATTVEHLSELLERPDVRGRATSPTC